MADTTIDLRRVDIPAFAKSDRTWRQRLPMQTFPRVVASAHPDVPIAIDAGVDIAAHADVEQRHGEAQYGLSLIASGDLAMVCQRCLAPVVVPLNVDRRFLFVADEATAAALDADLDDDVLALEQPFDLLTLVEDELVLAMPLVPVHAVCPEPLPVPADDPDASATEPAHPFAALARLKAPSDTDEQ